MLVSDAGAFDRSPTGRILPIRSSTPEATNKRTEEHGECVRCDGGDVTEIAKKFEAKIRPLIRESYTLIIQRVCVRPAIEERTF